MTMTLSFPKSTRWPDRFFMVLGEQEWDLLFPGQESPVIRETVFGTVEHIRSEFLQESPVTPLTLKDVPEVHFPIHVAPGIRRQCGWWIVQNNSGLADRKGHEVRYCSLPHGHVRGHVWQNPPLHPSHAKEST